MTHELEFEINNSTEPANNPIHEAVEFYWGERCTTQHKGCPTCTAWNLYDNIIKEGLK